MAGISMAMLRRALAEMAEGVGSGARNAYHGFHVDRGVTYGAIPGGIAGGVAGAASAPEGATDDERYGRVAPGIAGGVIGGALLGAGGGLGVKALSMMARGASEGSYNLRRALADMAAERGAGRAATRDVGHVEDAVRFHTANEGDDVAMRGRHAEPDAMEPDADVDDLAGFQPTNTRYAPLEYQLERLKRFRRNATDPRDMEAIDSEIAQLNNLLGRSQ